MKVLFADSVHAILNENLSSIGVECICPSDINYETAIQIINDYDGLIIRSKFIIDKNFINAATKLKFIARAGSGMENIDVEYAEMKGIKCINSPEGNSVPVAEHALGLTLGLLHNINKSAKEISKGIWDRTSNKPIELNNSTIGIIGYGNTGSAFAKILSGFNVNVLSFDKYKHNYQNEFCIETSLEDILNNCNIISLHVPLTNETEYMINTDFINSVKKPFFLINTSRGKVINTSNLVNALKNGKILGAGLDVIEYEKTTFEELSSNINNDFNYLINSNKVIITPHIAGQSLQSYKRHAEILCNKILMLMPK